MLQFGNHTAFYFHFYLQIESLYICASKLITLNIAIDSNDIDREIDCDLYLVTR